MQHCHSLRLKTFLYLDLAVKGMENLRNASRAGYTRCVHCGRADNCPYTDMDIVLCDPARKDVALSSPSEATTESLKVPWVACACFLLTIQPLCPSSATWGSHSQEFQLWQDAAEEVASWLDPTAESPTMIATHLAWTRTAAVLHNSHQSGTRSRSRRPISKLAKVSSCTREHPDNC